MPASNSQLPAAASRSLRLHVWAQSFAANPGGIQTFTRFVVQALEELYPEAEIVVFAKNDRGGGMEDVDREGAIDNTRGGCDPQADAKNDRSKEIDGEGTVSGTRVARAQAGRQCGPRAEAKNATPHLGPLLDRGGEEVLAPSSQLLAPGSQLPTPTTSVVGFGRWPAPLRAMAFTVGVIWRAVRTRQLPDGVTTIVISTHVNFAPVGRLVKWFANVLFAAVGHGIEVWSIQKASVREGLRRTDQLIAVSEFTKSRMAAAIGVNESRIEVLPNTFDADKFQPGPKPAALLERYGLTVDQPVILTVARLAETEQYKGYDNVLLALPAVLQRFPDARYVIVGDGPDRKRVERLSKELGVEKKVILAGYVPNEELSGHYNLCDVFVMPSKGEGFGIVFLEALGCGKPVIAGNKDASVEAVLHGRLGVMVNPDDEEQIAEAIGRVLAERDQRSRLRPATAWQAADSGQQTENREPITDNGESRFDGAMLRREVIATYGFERFCQRLGEIVRLLVNR